MKSVQKGLALLELTFFGSVINEEGFKNEKLGYFKIKTHLCDLFGIKSRDR